MTNVGNFLQLFAPALEMRERCGARDLLARSLSDLKTWGQRDPLDGL